MVNPLTALPDLLGKLGSEHFSAEVQRTHIALLKEQFGVLERENKKLASEKAELQTENKILKAKNKTLEKENINLKKKIETHRQPPVCPSLPNECIEILRTITTIEKPFGLDRELSHISESFLAETFKLSEQKTKYYLDLLNQADCIEMDIFGIKGASHKGRGVLLERGILP